MTFVRVLLIFCVIAAVVFIFSNSMQTGSESSGRSGTVMEWLCRLADGLHIAPQYRPTEFIIRKMGHLSEFALLGFLLLMMLRSFTPRLMCNMGWILFAALSVGTADEGIQMFTPGRSSEVRDVMIDFAGAVCGIVLAVLIVKAAEKHAEKKIAQNRREIV